MKRLPLITAGALAVGLAGSTAGLAESMLPSGEDTGMSWKALNNEIYDTQRSRYIYPGGGVPGNAYSGPGQVYGGAPAGYAAPTYVAPPAYAPYGSPYYQPPAAGY